MLKINVLKAAYRQGGFRTVLKVLRGFYLGWLETKSTATQIAIGRVWQLLLVAAGGVILTKTPWPGPWRGSVDVDELVKFALGVAFGLGIFIKGLVGIVASFSTRLMVHNYKVRISGTLIRALLVAAVGAVSLQFQPEQMVWVLMVVGLVVWTLYPLINQLFLVIGGQFHLAHRISPLDKLLAVTNRKMSDEQVHGVAIHEAGHALFFGLGNTIPEDLYAVLVDEIPTLNQDIAALNNSIGGAVGAFASLAEAHFMFKLHQRELMAFLGLLAGGAAAEQLVFHQISMGAVDDLRKFEVIARQYLSVYSDERFPFFAAPADDSETALNAKTLATFKSHVVNEACAFLNANRAALEEVARQLKLHTELCVDELKVLLANIQPTETFQKFDWPKTVPHMEWESIRG